MLRLASQDILKKAVEGKLAEWPIGKTSIELSHWLQKGRKDLGWIRGPGSSSELACAAQDSRRPSLDGDMWWESGCAVEGKVGEGSDWLSQRGSTSGSPDARLRQAGISQTSIHKHVVSASVMTPSRADSTRAVASKSRLLFNPSRDMAVCTPAHFTLTIYAWTLSLRVNGETNGYCPCILSPITAQTNTSANIHELFQVAPSQTQISRCYCTLSDASLLWICL